MVPPQVALGMPPEAHGEEIKRMWRLNGEHKSGLGTVLHRQIELYLNRAPPDASSAEFAQFMVWEAEYPQMLPVRTEMNLWVAELQLAGQLDALFWDACEQQFVLVDFKRVEKLEMESKDGKWGLPPFQHLPNTNWGHYCCQQQAYSSILRRFYGVPVARMYLLQLHESLSGYRFIEVPECSAAMDEAFAARAAEVVAWNAAVKKSPPEGSSA